MMDPSIFRETARAAVSAQGGDFDLADFKYLETNDEIGKALASYPAIKSVLTDQGYWGGNLKMAIRAMAIHNSSGVILFMKLYPRMDKGRIHSVLHTLVCKADKHSESAAWYSQSCCVILDSASAIDPLIRYQSFRIKNNNIYSQDIIYDTALVRSTPIPYSQFIGAGENKLTQTGEYVRVKSMLKEMGIARIPDNAIIINSDDLANMKEQLQLSGYFERYDEAERTLEIKNNTYRFHLHYQKPGIKDDHKDSFEHIFTFKGPIYSYNAELIRHQLTITLDAENPSKSFVYRKLFKKAETIPDVLSASDIALSNAMHDRLSQSRKSLTDSTRKLSSNRIKRGNKLT